MRTEKEIREKIAHLKELQVIANNHLKHAMDVHDEREETYWAKTVIEFGQQINGLEYALGEW